MIDTVTFAWGEKIGTEPRRVDKPLSGRTAEPAAEPIHLDWDDLEKRYGSPRGEIRKINYDGGEHLYGHWPLGHVDFLYNGGRVELRASLPKLLTGQNDIVLDQAGVHDALRELERTGSEITGTKLRLREAVPTRIDYCFQYDVPSVAWVVEHLRAKFQPAGKLRTENLSPLGGRSIVWGYGSKRAIRFYDKGAEIAEKAAREISHGIPAEQLRAMSEHERKRAIAKARAQARQELWRNGSIDTLLRYEIQERRPQHLRLVHEHGYTAADVRHELQRTIEALTAASYRDFPGLVESYDGWVHAIAYAGASFHFAEHPEDLVFVRRLAKDRKTAYKWRRNARVAQRFTVADWSAAIPEDAFEASCPPLWLALAA